MAVKAITNSDASGAINGEETLQGDFNNVNLSPTKIKGVVRVDGEQYGSDTVDVGDRRRFISDVTYIIRHIQGLPRDARAVPNDVRLVKRALERVAMLSGKKTPKPKKVRGNPNYSITQTITAMERVRFRDVLHNLADDSGASNEYCKGIIVGTVNALMLRPGWTFDDAIAFVRDNVPSNNRDAEDVWPTSWVSVR
jgi:hypothetical protein